VIVAFFAHFSKVHRSYIFLHKLAFLMAILIQKNQVCHKVSLRKNFQRQSCSTTIHPSNSHRYWHETQSVDL